MDVILALERMWVALLILNSLDLNRGMVKLVLASQQVSHLSQRLQRLDRLDVAGHCDVTN